MVEKRPQSERRSMCHYCLFGLILCATLFRANNVSAQLISLDTNWSITNKNKSISLTNQRLPSGVYSALEEANITESILFSDNDVKLRWISHDNWTYSLKFDLPNADILKQQYVNLVFHGVDTIADIYLNEQFIGLTENMFVRYRFDTKPFLRAQNNTLRVEITSPTAWAKELHTREDYTVPPECPPTRYNGECHMNMLRKMQASFAWDWGLAAPSMGLWKPVELQVFNSAIIRDVSYGLEETPDAWLLYVQVYLEAGTVESLIQGVLDVTLIDVENQTPIKQTINTSTDRNGEFMVEVFTMVAKRTVNQWWPNGYGPQNLYYIHVQWEDHTANSVKFIDRKYWMSEKYIRIGFRTVKLVHETMDNGLSFYFQVNGIPMFMKGSNYIPAHILPEKAGDEEHIRYLMRATRNANMNMLRVWGGGLYESDYFFDQADEMGILIWHDMMFACAMYPSNKFFVNSVRDEIRQNIQRLQKHPSIAVWATNNENEVALRQNWYNTGRNFSLFNDDYVKLYVTTVKDEIQKIDRWRDVLVSSPSNGNYEGEKENWIAHNPQDTHYGDIHFYTYDLNGWDSNIYPQPRFASEYGFQSFPSYNSWLKVLNGSVDKLESLIEHRQHFPLGSAPIKVLIERNLPKLEASRPDYQKALIYFSQIAQAMATKTETEVFISGRASLMHTMGALYWQLNDVWVAPSWSSIEYNGQFKLLHHWIKDVFAPLSLIVRFNKLKKVDIYCSNDAIGALEPQKLTIEMKVFKWSSFAVVDEFTWTFEIPDNTVKLVDTLDIYQHLENRELARNEHVVEFILTGEDREKVLAREFVFPEPIKDAVGVRTATDNVQLRIGHQRCTFNVSTISLEIRANAPAIFVYIQLKDSANIDRYELSKNGFMQLEPINVVHMTFENSLCGVELEETDFEVMTVNQFMPARNGKSGTCGANL